MRTKTGVRFVASAMALALLAAACGDDDDDAPVAAVTTVSASDTTEATTGTTGGAGPATTVATEPATTTTAAPAEPVTIKIGFAYPDLSLFTDAFPKATIGDPELQILAAVEKARADGLLPVGHVDIELSIRKFSVLDDDDKQAVCQAFAEEDEVFAVLAQREFNAGSECLASRFDIPTINVAPFPPSKYESIGPSLFTMRVDEGTIARQFVAWAAAEGIFDDKSIGLIFDTRYEETTDILKEAMAAAGYSFVSEVSLTGEGIGEVDVAVVAQRLKADGADLIIAPVGSTDVGNVMAAANDIDYLPEWVDFDIQSHMGDVSASFLEDNHYDGTRAIAALKVGDPADNELDPGAAECLANYEEFAGVTIEPAVSTIESGELETLLMTCDLLSVLLAGLDAAVASGEEITAASLIAGLETVSGLSLAYWDSVSFSADKHSGADTWREVVYEADCFCFQPVGEFTPFDI